MPALSKTCKLDLQTAQYERRPARGAPDHARPAEALGRVLRHLAPHVRVLVLPPWDCLPYDRAPASRDVMGRRFCRQDHATQR